MDTKNHHSWKEIPVPNRHFKIFIFPDSILVKTREISDQLNIPSTGGNLRISEASTVIIFKGLYLLLVFGWIITTR